MPVIPTPFLEARPWTDLGRSWRRSVGGFFLDAPRKHYYHAGSTCASLLLEVTPFRRAVTAPQESWWGCALRLPSPLPRLELFMTPRHWAKASLSTFCTQSHLKSLVPGHTTCRRMHSSKQLKEWHWNMAFYVLSDPGHPPAHLTRAEHSNGQWWSSITSSNNDSETAG
jgi:hypothetical protein